MQCQNHPWSPCILSAQALGHIDAATQGLAPPMATFGVAG